MTGRVLVLLAAAASIHEYLPAATLPDTMPAVEAAAKVWGVESPVSSVSWARLGSCRRRLAWSVFAERSVTLNSGCKWSAALLAAVLTHETGHLLAMRPDHSGNPKSIMYPLVYPAGQVITEEDRKAITQ